MQFDYEMMDLEHIAYVLESNQIDKFVDIKFPPVFRSIYGPDGGMATVSLKKQSIVWRRSEEIFGKNNFKVFADKIEPNDIK